MRWLLRLYPRDWRDRYEEEMLEVLEQHKITPATVLDLLLGALDANWNYSGFNEGVTWMVNRLRSSVVMVFCAFMVFGVGWGLRQRLNDPLPLFNHAAQSHPALGVMFHAIFVAGCIAFLAFLAGGLPLLFISVRRALHNKQKNILLPFTIAVSCLVVFVAATFSLAVWHPLHHFGVVLFGYLALSAALLIVGTVMVSLMITRTEFKLSELKFTFIPKIVILFCMVVSVVLSVILIIMVTAYAPQLFVSQDVGSPLFTTGIILMALGAVFASMGLRRGMIKGQDQPLI